ncbi:hypothetical protein GUITHDRAFT_116919 [Guillardia theta CCMP2712]|uniref:Zn(2)-C6 fungal-type domain-containing protein n=1 Tax=Guillardia theta (strain CCMP2712) TaxID=905079 RepID=L1IKY3_GUITC|nr:hypothetical protein GUITHDRAFT_116919 [Guillardia theta CCMP2712]EKX36896.1 hypothetical protein GUITHDRAFT_116919 [Guillardia theta CCMP2712]|eukprot:XP_005823876.1 hypothetical protein GUITHDRAFT_116919 [Guillardia theta CCMP2712]
MGDLMCDFDLVSNEEYYKPPTFSLEEEDNDFELTGTAHALTLVHCGPVFTLDHDQPDPRGSCGPRDTSGIGEGPQEIGHQADLNWAVSAMSSCPSLLNPYMLGGCGAIEQSLSMDHLNQTNYSPPAGPPFFPSQTPSGPTLPSSAAQSLASPYGFMASMPVNNSGSRLEQVHNFMPDTESLEDGQAKRRRTRTKYVESACDFCKMKKKKCSSVRPCSTCIVMNRWEACNATGQDLLVSITRRTNTVLGRDAMMERVMAAAMESKLNLWSLMRRLVELGLDGSTSMSLFRCIPPELNEVR